MTRLLIALTLAGALGPGAALAQAAGQQTHGQMGHGGAKDDAALIASAMSAAPPAVSKNATVIDVSPKGEVRVVRKGSSPFTCMADNPATPGPDPMCGDPNAMEWASAWMKRQPPPKKVGFMYMLAGGTDASNTDPFAKAPTAGNNWVETGPHVMIVGDPEIVKHYPAKPAPDTSQPYVMWSGTPYAHLMIPVR